MFGSSPAFHFDPEWRTTLFAVLMIPLLLGLGYWQVQRADEKAALESVFEVRQQQRPAPLRTLWDTPVASLAYLPVEMTGQFLQGKYLLLDNRIVDGQFGYEILGVLRLASGAAVLVNRGWVAGDAARRSLPEVPEPDGEIRLTGHVYVAPGAPYLLAEQQLDGDWPMRIQAVEMDKLAEPLAALLNDKVFPYPVRLDADAPGALAVNWQIINMSPSKHQGYAVQWFAMAAVLLLFYILRSSNLWQVLVGSKDKQKDKQEGKRD